MVNIDDPGTRWMDTELTILGSLERRKLCLSTQLQPNNAVPACREVIRGFQTLCLTLSKQPK